MVLLSDLHRDFVTMLLFQNLSFTMPLQRLLSEFSAFGQPGNLKAVYASPMVNVLNGSYVGVHNDYYNQNFFLGIPYAQPPVGDLRFRAPASLNSTWKDTREVVKYGDIVSLESRNSYLC